MTISGPHVFSFKNAVDHHLKTKLTTLKNQYKALPWAQDTFRRIIPFVTAGKTVRGSLVVYSYHLFQKTTPEHVLDCAAAMELFQAGLLIHDDILDRATIRRSMPTLHSQYEQFASKQKGTDIAHFGISQAINIADFCYFLGYSLLSKSEPSVTTLVSRELAMVALAQMQDVAGGHLPDTYDNESVIALYLHKTARYTFSMPLLVGSSLAQANDQTKSALEQLGESLGMLFQIRDDELSAQGDTMAIGKSADIDQQDHKQTLATIMSVNELEKFRRQLRINAQTIIRSLPVSDDHIRELTALLQFCEDRSK